METEQGAQPVTRFLDGLDSRYEASVDGLLDLLERIASDPQRPKALGARICHQIEGPIWQIGKGDIRLVWFAEGHRIIVCCHGFLKKSGKTPTSDLKAAKRIRQAITGKRV